MSIRMLARDLYHLEKEVERLENELNSAPLEERPELKDRLRKVKADRDKLRRALEGSKETPPYRRPR